MFNKRLCACAAVLAAILIIFCDPTLAQIEWVRSPRNPVLDIGEAETWDSGGVRDPSVLFKDGVFEMWYTGGGPGFTDLGEVGRALSIDGASWRKDKDNPVLKKGGSGAWDALGLLTPYVLFDEGIYKMWYTGAGMDGVVAIGYATSTDGVHWTKFEGNPLIKPGEFNTWDGFAVLSPVVIREQDRYKMWYVGLVPSRWQIGYATSPDGIRWTKFEDNPVLQRRRDRDMGRARSFRPLRIGKGRNLHNVVQRRRRG